jgi:hypothetical protein
MKPFFYFCIRLGNWMITRDGLFRWGVFVAAKPMRNGTHAKRQGWRRIFPKPKQ